MVAPIGGNLAGASVCLHCAGPGRLSVDNKGHNLSWKDKEMDKLRNTLQSQAQVVDSHSR